MEYDYYYSAKAEAHMRFIAYTFGELYKPNEVNGSKYTEMITAGKTPLTAHFGDLVKVYTG